METGIAERIIHTCLLITSIITILLIATALIIIPSWLVVQVLNLLFQVHIDFNIWTWAGASMFLSLISSSFSVK